MQDASRRLGLTARDREVIAEVFLQRALTRRHLQGLGHFASTAVANSRLRRLFDANYLRRVFVPSGAFATEAVYLTGRKAIPELVSAVEMSRAEVERLARQDAPLFLAHALAVADLRVAFGKADNGRKTFTWLTEPECRHEYVSAGRRHVLKPDGGMLVDRGGQLSLRFIEVDRGHVSNAQFAKSCASYRRYIESGLVQETYGAACLEILCTTSSGDRRIGSLAAAAESEGVAMLFATQAAAEDNPFGAVWRRGPKEEGRALPEVRP